MPENLAIYSTLADLMPGEIIAQLAEGARCTPSTSEQGRSGYDLAWPNLTVTLRHRHYQQADFADHIRGFLPYILNLAEGQMDGRLWEIYYAVSKSRQCVGLTIEPDWDEQIAPQLVAALAETACGFVFVGGMLTDPWGGLILGPDNERGEGVLYSFDSAKARRERSGGRLAMLGLSTPESLPTTVADEEAILAAPDEVARRAVCLMGVAMRAEGIEQQKVAKFLEQRGLVGALSPGERAFLKKAHPDPAEMSQLTWRYEALWTLLWALGHLESLGPPGTQADARQAIKIVNAAPAEPFIKRASLRDAAEILDELDFYYRAHWHAVNARQAGLACYEGLDPDVIQERHYALNWLTSYMYQEWDDISTDT